eukprot:scaffold2066_cov229-Ochromonas_danica.AAC.35
MLLRKRYRRLLEQAAASTGFCPETDSSTSEGFLVNFESQLEEREQNVVERVGESYFQDGSLHVPLRSCKTILVERVAGAQAHGQFFFHVDDIDLIYTIRRDRSLEPYWEIDASYYSDGNERPNAVQGGQQQEEEEEPAMEKEVQLAKPSKKKHKKHNGEHSSRRHRSLSLDKEADHGNEGVDCVGELDLAVTSTAIDNTTTTTAPAVPLASPQLSEEVQLSAEDTYPMDLDVPLPSAESPQRGLNEEIRGTNGECLPDKCFDGTTIEDGGDVVQDELHRKEELVIISNDTPTFSTDNQQPQLRDEMGGMDGSGSIGNSTSLGMGGVRSGGGGDKVLSGSKERISTREFLARFRSKRLPDTMKAADTAPTNSIESLTNQNNCCKENDREISDKGGVSGGAEEEEREVVSAEVAQIDPSYEHSLEYEEPSFTSEGHRAEFDECLANGTQWYDSDPYDYDSSLHRLDSPIRDNVNVSGSSSLGRGRGKLRTLPAWLTESERVEEKQLRDNQYEHSTSSRISGYGEGLVEPYTSSQMFGERNGEEVGQPVAGRGRGRGRGRNLTLPAWMTSPPKEKDPEEEEGLFCRPCHPEASSACLESSMESAALSPSSRSVTPPPSPGSDPSSYWTHLSELLGRDLVSKQTFNYSSQQSSEGGIFAFPRQSQSQRAVRRVFQPRGCFASSISWEPYVRWEPLVVPASPSLSSWPPCVKALQAVQLKKQEVHTILSLGQDLFLRYGRHSIVLKKKNDSEETRQIYALTATCPQHSLLLLDRNNCVTSYFSVQPLHPIDDDPLASESTHLMELNEIDSDPIQPAEHEILLSFLSNHSSLRNLLSPSFLAQRKEELQHFRRCFGMPLCQ